MDGEYPLASWNALSVLFPQNRFVRNDARQTSVFGEDVVCSFLRRDSIFLKTPLFFSTIPFLLEDLEVF